MNDYLEQFLLEVVKDHLKSISDEQFLALTCNLTTLHDELIRMWDLVPDGHRIRAWKKVWK